MSSITDASLQGPIPRRPLFQDMDQHARPAVARRSHPGRCQGTGGLSHACTHFLYTLQFIHLCEDSYLVYMYLLEPRLYFNSHGPSSFQQVHFWSAVTPFFIIFHNIAMWGDPLPYFLIYEGGG